MTLPYERRRAVEQTEKFLLELIDPKATPKVPNTIRMQAKALLRHYPTGHDLEMIERAWEEPLIKMMTECPFKKSF